VISVSPATGLPSASTPIQIAGTGFVDGATLTLDGAATPVTFVSSALLRATAPPHPAGPIDVAVRNPNGATAELKGAFRYEVPITSLTIGGNTSLQSVGQTTQLTATAVYADGSTQDVTSAARWSVTVPGVVTISSDGVVTAQALGVTPIQVQYPPSGPSKFRSDSVTVTPPGTQAVWGRTRNPGAGSVPDASVRHDASGQSTRSNADGFFSIGGLTGPRRLSASKSGYEDAAGDPEEDLDFVDIPMQAVVRINPGAAAYSSSLAPNDVSYVIAGTDCQPCRMIRVTSPGPGTTSVTLRWTSTANLHMWIDGQMHDPATAAREIVVPVQVDGSEKVIFVGRAPATGQGGYVPFTLNVSAVQ
jgi:hypothetical protein